MGSGGAFIRLKEGILRQVCASSAIPPAAQGEIETHARGESTHRVLEHRGGSGPSGGNTKRSSIWASLESEAMRKTIDGGLRTLSFAKAEKEGSLTKSKKRERPDQADSLKSCSGAVISASPTVIWHVKKTGRS